MLFQEYAKLLSKIRSYYNMQKIQAKIIHQFKFSTMPTKVMVRLLEHDPNLILLATGNGNTAFHAWLQEDNKDDKLTFKLLHMFLDKLQDLDRIPFDFFTLDHIIVEKLKQSCERSVLLWTLRSLYRFHIYKSKKQILDNISFIVKVCSREDASDESKSKLREHLLAPILHFHKPKVLKDQKMEGLHYNASLFQTQPSEDLLDKVERYMRK